MMGSRHMTGGVGAWLLVAPMVHVDVGTTIATVPVAMFASLLPDIDHKRATLGRNPIGRIVQLFTEHRYETHSIITGAVASFLVYLVCGPAVASAVATGWIVGHTFLDWCTMQGVAVLWPLERRLRRAPWARFVRTNGASEDVMMFILGVVSFGLVMWRTLP